MRAARDARRRRRPRHTYGVNTGFGRFVSESIPDEQVEELQLRLLRSHACGVGEPYPDEVVRAAMLLRANALAKGYSGARVETVELLLECLNRGVLPRVPRRGSVGASGDLAPLAHLALPLVGEGEAWVDGELLAGRRGARARRARADPARGEGRPLAHQRHAVHGRDRRARRSCARGGSRGPPTSPARCRSRRCRARATSFHPADPRAAAAARTARLRRERAPPARGLGDHRVAPLVRQGAGRLLAALRAAGARRQPRPARLRRGDGRGRAERGDRQPARVRRRGHRSSRTATSTASRSRSRSTRWRWRSPSSRASPSGASSGSSTRRSRTGCRRSSPPTAASTPAS